MALGTRSATHIVSCAAPECIVVHGSPESAAAASSAPTTAASSGVAGSDWRSTVRAVMPRRSAARSAKAAVSRATPWKSASRGPRTSSEKRASAATALIRLGSSSISPTVPTVPPPASVARRSSSSTVSASTVVGSSRRPIGVAPAWSPRPVTKTSACT